MKCGREIEADVKSDSFDKIINTANFASFNAYQEYLLEDYHRYLDFLINIAQKANMNHLNLLEKCEYNKEDMSALLNLSLIAVSFCDVNFDPDVSKLGNYYFNLINIDQSLLESEQITSYIHQLSNHLFAEIFEELLSNSLDMEKDDSLEAFIAYTLGSIDAMLINEVCAYSVCRKFIPKEYLDVSKLNFLFKNLIENNEDVEYLFTLGNTFAEDIFMILNPFIDEELIEKIAVQFKKDFGDNFVYERPIIEENRVYSDYAKYSTMFYIIESGISSALTGHFDKDLNMLKEGFEIVNSNRRNSPLL